MDTASISRAFQHRGLLVRPEALDAIQYHLPRLAEEDGDHRAAFDRMLAQIEVELERSAGEQGMWLPHHTQPVPSTPSPPSSPTHPPSLPGSCLPAQHSGQQHHQRSGG
jgi:hypothetical protein